MRQVVVTQRAIEVVEVPRVVPGPGEVLVRTVLAGICGSDLHAARGRHPFVSLPYRPGHEAVGVVESAGVVDSGAGFVPGTRVTLEPYLPCWDCKQCRAGRPNLCERLGFFGCGYPQGAMADWFTVDARRLHVLPDAVDDDVAVLAEPLATPVHALRLAGGVADRTVAVLGMGTIGLLTLRLARAYGARRIVVTARSAQRRAAGLASGADAAVDATAVDAVEQVRAALGESADVVVDCVAEEPTVRQAMGIADKGGTVVVVGVPPGDVSVPLHRLQDSQIRLQGSATYLPEDFAEAIGLLAAGRVSVGDLVTAVYPLADAARAFEAAGERSNTKVVLRA